MKNYFGRYHMKQLVGKTLFLIPVLYVLLTGCSPNAPRTTIYRSPYSQEFVITSPAGIRIFINVATEKFLPKDLSENDILLVTHDTWYDVYNPDLIAHFPGKKLIAIPGRIEQGDVAITSISAKYGDSDVLNGNTHYCAMLIETGGIRILHMGETVQSAPEASQVKYFMHPDVLIAPVYNGYDDGSLRKAKIAFISTVKPRIVIPTQYDDHSIRQILHSFSGKYLSTKDSVLRLDRVSLPPNEAPVLLLLESLPAVKDYLKKTFQLEPFPSDRAAP